jgi:hypothetical protein
MNIKKNIFYLFVTCFYIKNFAQPKFLITSIPKSGTHLLAKAIQNITHKSMAWIAKPYDDLYTCLEEKKIDSFLDTVNFNLHFVGCHEPYSKEIENYLQENKYKIICIARDPRDRTVSLLNWIYRCSEESLGSYYEIRQSYTKKYTRSELLSLLITDLNPVDQVYKKYYGWLHSPICLTVRFEDLVGSKGGGSDLEQIRTVKKIADFLEVALSDEQIKNICSNLFGGTWTFKEGLLGSWRKEFREEDKNKFKQYAQETLKLWAYEQDELW